MSQAKEGRGVGMLLREAGRTHCKRWGQEQSGRAQGPQAPGAEGWDQVGGRQVPSSHTREL